MKALQVGILILLLVVAGLLYVIYRGQSSQPAIAPATSETAAAPAPELEPPGAPASAPAAAPPAPAERAAARPSPARGPVPKAEPAAGTTPAQTTPATAPVSAPEASAPPAQPPAAPSAAASPARAPLTPPSGTAAGPPAPATPHKVTVPAGTLLTVRLVETVSSEKNQAGDSFTATLDQPLVIEGFVLAERGARVQGRVLEVEQSGRVRGLASLKIHLVQLRTSDGQDVKILTEPFAKTAEASTGDDAKKIGVGAAIGAAVGAIAGGGRGAAIGAGVGGAAGTGTVLATRGKPAVLPSETRLTFRLQEPVTLVEKLK